MAWIECPTRSNLPAYTYRLSLEGEAYQLTFTFNDRMGKWFLSLSDSNKALLVGPVPMAANWPLFGRFVSPGLPPGQFYAFDTSGKGEDPGRFDLGGRVRLLYKESTT